MGKKILSQSEVAKQKVSQLLSLELLLEDKWARLWGYGPYGVSVRLSILMPVSPLRGWLGPLKGRLGLL